MTMTDLRVSVEETEKKQVKAILASKNMNVSEYFRLAVKILIDTGEIPFDVKKPNLVTLSAIKRGKAKAKKLNEKYQEIKNNVE